MKCEKCGWENLDDAKFCANCGSPLSKAEEVVELTNGSTEPSADEKPTEVSDAEKPKTNEGGLPALDILNRFTKKQLGIAVGAVVGVIVVIVAAVLLVGGSSPSDSMIVDDVRSSMADWSFSASSQTYNEIGKIDIDSVEIESKTKREIPSMLKEYYGDYAYDVKAVVKGSNDQVDAEAVVSASYTKSDGKWQAISVSPESKSYSPKQGVSKEKIEENADSILSSASIDDSSYLYFDPAVEVGDVSFDKDNKTCSAEVTYTQETVFSSAKAVVTASFEFGDYGWSLSDVKADDGADEISYEKLVGTWKGTFEEQSVNAGNNDNCYGAKGKDLIVKIDSIDPVTLVASGTFTGTAHYHGTLESVSNSTEGDETVGPIAFQLPLDRNERIKGSNGSAMSVEVGGSYIEPESDKMRLSFAIGFGTSDNPNVAYANMTTDGNSPNAMFVPEAYFSDWYKLTKEE